MIEGSIEVHLKRASDAQRLARRRARMHREALRCDESACEFIPCREVGAPVISRQIAAPRTIVQCAELS